MADRAKRFWRVLRTSGAYGKSVASSAWFYVCLAGTLFGIAAPFFPPFKSAVPLWVGLLIALVSWTLAPLRAYHQLLERVAELERRPVQVVQEVEGVEGVVVNAGGDARVSITQNITKRYVVLNSPSTEAVSGAVAPAFEDFEIAAEGEAPALEGGAADVVPGDGGAEEAEGGPGVTSE